MGDEVFSTGIDIEEVLRIEAICSRPEFLSRFFTENERLLFEKKGKHAAESIAANFCAKEAVIKALNKKIGNLGDIEVLRTEDGKPYINLIGALSPLSAEYSLELSLTHTSQIAAAVVVACKQGERPDYSKYPLSLIKPRPQNSHKGTFGALELHCGSTKMTGAAVLCASAALRSGVGLVYMPLPSKVRKIVQHHLCEPVFAKSNRATAFVIGCGLTVRRSRILKKLVNKGLPTVIDADALTYLSKHMNILDCKNTRLVLTPHPLEFSRLLQGAKTVAEIEENRESLAKSFAKEHGVTIVLKGHRTVVATQSGFVYTNQTGNSGLAKGGSGDVLAGLIGGLLAQGYEPKDAAVLGVYLHGLAAQTQQKTESAVLPRDICVEIGNLLYDKQENNQS